MDIETENKIANFPAISYEFRYELLLSKGFEEPFLANLVHRYQRGVSVCATGDLSCWEFKRGEIRFCLSEWELRNNRFPVIKICKNEINLAETHDPKEMDNIMTVIDGIVNRDKLLLCVDIDWAAPLVETLCRGE